MAKRYHNSKRSKHEMRGGPNSMPMSDTVQGHRRENSAMHKEGHIVGKAMSRDAGMIHDDWNAPALLPQHVIEKYWPTAYNTHMGMVDDLFNGVQKQLHEDYNDLGREMGPKKY